MHIINEQATGSMTQGLKGTVRMLRQEKFLI